MCPLSGSGVTPPPPYFASPVASGPTPPPYMWGGQVTGVCS